MIDLRKTTRIDFEDKPVCGTPVTGFCIIHGRQVIQLAIKMHSATKPFVASAPELSTWEWVYLGNGTVYEPFLLLVRLAIETEGVGPWRRIQN